MQTMRQQTILKSPFPYFGGKSTVASLVWERFGDVPNYVEPFFGSGAVLLARPHAPRLETVNDKDGYVANFLRALQADPESVACHADWPAFENDLHARHAWLTVRKSEFTARLEGDPDYYDAKAAGWWVWGMACWIGSGFTSGEGPWQSIDGKLVKTEDAVGVKRQRLRLGNAGVGVKRGLLHLGDAGRGIKAQRANNLHGYLEALADRFRRVRVCCGDWSRICGDAPTIRQGLTGVFLDPPYSDESNRSANIYAEEDLAIAHDVRKWAIERGDNPLFRIALCGYDGEHTMPNSWECLRWKAHGGYGNRGNGRGKANRHRECVWFSPHCLKSVRQQLELFKEGL